MRCSLCVWIRSIYVERDEEQQESNGMPARCARCAHCQPLSSTIEYRLGDATPHLLTFLLRLPNHCQRGRSRRGPGGGRQSGRGGAAPGRAREICRRGRGGQSRGSLDLCRSRLFPRPCEASAPKPKASFFLLPSPVCTPQSAVPGPTKRRPAVDLSKLRKGGALPSLPVTRLRLCLSLSRPSVRAWLCVNFLGTWKLRVTPTLASSAQGRAAPLAYCAQRSYRLSPKVGRDQAHSILYLQQSLWHPNGAIL